MEIVTRRALRVYAALSELKDQNGDILDAIIPFFEPILEVMNGSVFDPKLLAVGVRKIYRWPFTRDVAEQFIPRLQKKGYLERVAGKTDVIYLVRFQPIANAPENADIQQLINSLVEKFEKFPPLITDLLHYKKTREELADILIRFVVSLDAYDQQDLLNEIDKSEIDSDGRSFLKQIPEGGRPLSREDRYMAARFVRQICLDDPTYVPMFARLASIGLLTEVVEDFLKPTQPANKTELAIFVDAPLALDFLGLSGKTFQDDVASVFGPLTAVGCSFFVFPETCDEMERNLKSMLSLPATKRRGYTHQAMVRGEVDHEYVKAVARNPQKALEASGIKVRYIDAKLFPNSHVHFTSAQYEDFLSYVTWVQDLAPREHDATCFALLMRLRGGRNDSDLFNCKYVFVTRNATFANRARKYCLQSRFINAVHEAPVIHQRELATIAWLRTGLNAEEVPRAHLMSHCERVLRVRPEVTAAVSARLSQVTEDKVKQFELLLLDHRSIQKLADETLNIESVVTDDNAEVLLETMRRATVEEEHARYQAELRQVTDRHRQAQAKLKKERAERDEHIRFLEGQREESVSAQKARLKRAIDSNNKLMRWIDRGITGLLICGFGLGVLNSVTGWLQQQVLWIAVTLIFAALGFYHFAMELLCKPKIGVGNVLTFMAKRSISKSLEKLGISDIQIDHIKIEGGQIKSIE